MTLFDAYVMVDWSSNSTPKGGKDSIWIAYAERREAHVEVDLANPRTRLDAYHAVRDLLCEATNRGMRVLVGFDFPYGYPGGFTRALGLADEPWRAVWRELTKLVVDEPDNRNNRWEVASELNRRLGGVCGPFWNAPTAVLSGELQRTRGAFPFASALCELHEFRTVELRLRETGRQAHSCWKLFTAGSVGSQALLGIPVLERLRSDPEFAPVSKVWPFETGFTAPTTGRGPSIVHAEIWPGAFETDLALEPVKDAAQMRGLAMSLAQLDEDDALAPLFGEPTGLRNLAACTTEEGWILGA